MSRKRKKKYGKVLAKHGGGVVRKFHTGGLIIYGAGAHLQDMLVWYDDLAGRIVRVVDKDTEKIGKKAPGLACEVESPEVLKGLPVGTWVVVSALRYYYEIVKELHELNPGLVCPDIDQAYALLKQAEANGLLVYGAGAHLADMLSWHPALKDRIGRIFDKDKKKQGAKEAGTGKLVEGFDELKHLPAGTQIAVSAIRHLHEIAEEVYALNPGLICQHIDDVYSRLPTLLIQTTASVPASPVCEVLEENEVLYLPEVLHKAKEKKIDIVIPIYNALEHLKKCVESLLRNTSVDYELYLINDRSSDTGIEEYLKSLSVCSAPYSLKKLHIIENSSNMGFVKTVNKGLELSSNDVVILNTDTEVPPAWAERFIFAYGNDDKIASITPFSNSATICSFPEFLINNEIYKGKSVEEIDRVFKDCNFDRPIEIPTAVGFCMFMSRKAIDEIGLFDEIFGHGYGEENDWCMRAAQKGYKNVFLPNLYVYHKHGASFNDKGSKKREKLRNRNHDILIGKYPTYDAEVQRYIHKNPADKIRKIIRWRLDSVGEPILFIMPKLEGGVKIYQDMQIEEIKAKRTTYAMYLENDLNSLVIKNNSLGKEQLVFDFGTMSSDMFVRLFNLLGIKEIFINHLIIYPLSKVMSYIMDADIPYTYFIHDFYPVCPKYTLIDIHGKYCGAEKSGNVCDKCFYKHENSSDCIETAEPISNIYTYRSLWNYFLQNAKKIIAPSQFVKNVMKKYYPTCEVEVREHALGNEIRKTFREDFIKDEVLVVTVLGAINEVKGYDVIYDLAERIYESNYKILINVIGTMKGHEETFEEFDGTLCCRGRYKRENVSLMLAEYKTSMVLIPSVCPETFSYTTHEAVESGYPVLCFDIGAHGEFVKKTGCGWALSEINVDVLYEKLVFLYKNRDEIVKKSRWQRIGDDILLF